jgi:hypothetical protein
MKFSTNLKKYDDVRTLSNDDLICYCCDVDKKTIIEAIQNGSRTLKEIKKTTKGNAVSPAFKNILCSIQPTVVVVNTQVFPKKI